MIGGVESFVERILLFLLDEDSLVTFGTKLRRNI